jgi:DtxR family transcriptional regulator, Mn-dependent transcriptional regulator
MSETSLAETAHNAHPARDRAVREGAENYLKTIYQLQARSEGAVGTGPVAERLGVTPASASAMLKRLADDGLVEHTPYHGVRLTDEGEHAALEVIRHHRLIELFLAEVLEVPWDRVHVEAEVLEHHISPELAESIARKLGDPTRDPHGDPIPSSDLEMEERETVPLDSLGPGQGGTFVRITDSDPEMLRYLSGLGIAPGDRFEIAERQPFGGPLSVRFGDSVEVLGGRLAEAMRVEPG